MPCLKLTKKCANIYLFYEILLELSLKLCDLHLL